MSHVRSVGSVVVMVSMLGSGLAWAQPTAAPAATPAAPAQSTAVSKPTAPTAAAREQAFTAARDALARADEAGVQQGLASLAAIGGERSAQAVIVRLRSGLPPQLAESAIDTLVLLGRPSASTALLEQAVHNRASIRERAISALGALHIRAAQSALLFALDDPNPQVRAAAVASLGAVGNARALPALFVASERHIEGAYAAIGLIARASDLKALLTRAPNGDVTSIKPALLAIMQRADFPMTGKLGVVRELSQLASPSARVCLVEWLDAYKTVGPPNLRKALFDAIKRLDELDKAKSKVIVETTGTKS